MRSVAIVVSSLLLIACSSKHDSDSAVQFDSDADSALAVIQTADSTYTVRHSQYKGKHMHQGDAAEASHQDVNRMRRIQKKEVEQFDQRKQAYESQEEQRRQRIEAAKKQREEEEIIY